MQKIDLGIIGNSGTQSPRLSWSELIQHPQWQQLIQQLLPGSFPSEIQEKTLTQGQLLTTRRNLILNAPTNSGKTLLAYLALFRAAIEEKRALLLVPLRAIAEEKYEELTQLEHSLESVFGKKIGVTISTGAYRLDEESLQSPPPDEGEVIVATPERIECILRNPEFDSWSESMGVVCIDEAHLLGDRIRGATLEYLVTSFINLPSPPQIILLSATLGKTSDLESWLQPCDSLVSTLREPKLQQWAVALEAEEDPKEKVIELVKTILENPEHSLLIFVYQIAWANSLTKELNTQLGNICGLTGAQAYHSRLKSESKKKIREQFIRGDSRCVVTTAALAMGVNLPASHVLIRDLSYGKDGNLREGDLLQMAGRAGRGQQPGQAYFLCKSNGSWNPTNLKESLNREYDAKIQSTLLPLESNTPPYSQKIPEPPHSKIVLSLLSRNKETGMTQDQIEIFLQSTLAGFQSQLEVQSALEWLKSENNFLVYEENKILRPTTLGNTIIRASLPLSVGSGIAGLFRDIFSVDPHDRCLSEMTGLDVLVLTELVAAEKGIRVKFSKKLMEGVDRWMEVTGNPSLFYKEWIRGDVTHSKSDQIMGSLNLKHYTDEAQSHSHAYLACFQAIILWQRAHGTSVADLERRWGKSVHGLDEFEEKWRDDRLFLISAMLNLWDVKVFYFHLKNDCDANEERIKCIKRRLQKLRAYAYQTMDLVGWCSPLGPVFTRLRSALGRSGKANPAKGTMRQLEEKGVQSIEQLKSLNLDDLLQLGIRKNFANKIIAFTRRSG